MRGVNAAVDSKRGTPLFSQRFQETANYLVLKACKAEIVEFECKSDGGWPRMQQQTLSAEVRLA